jgi:hypothetical protein
MTNIVIVWFNLTNIVWSNTKWSNLTNIVIEWSNLTNIVIVWSNLTDIIQSNFPSSETWHTLFLTWKCEPSGGISPSHIPDQTLL